MSTKKSGPTSLAVAMAQAAVLKTDTALARTKWYCQQCGAYGHADEQACINCHTLRANSAISAISKEKAR